MQKVEGIVGCALWLRPQICQNIIISICHLNVLRIAPLKTNPLGLTWAVSTTSLSACQCLTMSIAVHFFFSPFSLFSRSCCLPRLLSLPLCVSIYMYIFYLWFYFKWSAFIRWQSFFLCSLALSCASFHLNLRWHPADDEWPPLSVFLCILSVVCLYNERRWHIL